MKYFVGIIVAAAIAGGGYYYWQKNKVETPKTTVTEEQKQEEMSPPPNLPPQGGGTGEKEEETKVSVQEISMTAGNFFFSPKEITLKKGRPVKITIQNTGNHTFTIDELGVNKDLADGSTVVEFTPETEDVFIYYCSTPGHRLLGQWGTVSVEE